MLGTKFRISQEIQYLPPLHLRHHHENDEIYNPDEIKEGDELLEDIRINGIRQPLMIQPDGTLLSGMRRLKRALKLDLDEVPCIVMAEMNENDQRIALVSFNQYRVKTPLEIYREAQAIKKSIKHGQGRKSKAVAEKMNIGSYRQFERLEKVVESAPKHIVQAVDKGEIAISAAYEDLRHLEQQDPEIEQRARALLDSGNERDIKTAVRKARRAIIAEQKPIINSEPESDSSEESANQVIQNTGLLVFYPYDVGKSKTPWEPTQSTNDCLIGKLNGTPIKDHLLDNGLLFLWSYANTVPFALQLLKNWGFEFITLAGIRSANGPWVEKGFIPEDTSVIIIAKKQGVATPRLGKVKGNSLTSNSRQGAFALTAASLVDFVMAFGDGPYLQVWGPNLPERCEDESWLILRP